jgi:dTDP-4-dehydrorhamnose reductase
MRVLVTGAAGMLGTSLVPILSKEDHTVLATDINLLSDSIKELDVRDLEKMLEVARDFRPHIIAHLAAETDLETCEGRIEYAYEENFLGTQNACVVSSELGIPLVYISTAGVFDGTKTEPYTEFDVPTPINVYGSSKFHGEQIVRETLSRHFIVRAGWMVGGGERDKKFVSKIVCQLESGAKTIHAVTDRFGTPTYAPAFSVILERLIKTKLYGTYHLACKGRASRYDVAAEILKVLGRDDVELKAVTSEFFGKEYFAPRPVSEEMRNFILELRSMNDMPQWQEALEEYLGKHFAEYFD